MVKVTCSDCGEVLLEKKGLDVNTDEIGECPKCGCDKKDIDIGG